MFVEAIDNVLQFTRPLHTISRNFGEEQVMAGSATMFFVNEDGVAITCKHVAQMLIDAENINNHFNQFKNERSTFTKSANYNRKIKELTTKYNFTKDSTCELYIQFLNCASSWSNIDIILHPTYDLAIVKLVDARMLVSSHATFIGDTSVLKQGYTMCRIGYPFPEFNNYQYNVTEDKIEWTTTGRNTSPAFPIDGMLTRHLMDEQGIMGVELSTPGLRGQSGGPLFNKEGLVCGMQSATNHLHLGFDMKQQDMIANGVKIKVTNQPFLHVGHCVHADIIKAFLKQHNVAYYEA